MSTSRQKEVLLQAQQMVMDTLGLALCVGLTFSVRQHPKLRLLLPLLTFPFLVTTDLLCIYQELKATHLSTLNRERAELLAERWLLDGLIFTAKEVSTALHETCILIRFCLDALLKEVSEVWPLLLADSAQLDTFPQ